MKSRVLGLAIVLILLVIGTNDAFAQHKEIQIKSEKTTLQEKRLHKQQARHKSQLEVWQKRLELTDEQVAAIEPYFSEYRTEVYKIKGNTNLSYEERKTAAKKLRKEYDSKFVSHLTASQKAEYDRIRNTKGQLKATPNK